MTYITYNPKILGGKPIVKGTRISVDFILELLGSGMTTEEIRREYPKLTKQAIQEVFTFAAHNIRREEFVPVQ